MPERTQQDSFMKKQTDIAGHAETVSKQAHANHSGGELKNEKRK